MHNPPGEVDLDEIYCYRIDRPEGYAHQRPTLATEIAILHSQCTTDAVLVPDGCNPVVAGHGYNVYYLNCLAGSARLL